MSSPEPLWRLELGDCLSLLSGVESGSVGLAYLDPPFNTGKTRRGRGEHAATVYADSFGGGTDYREFLRPRLAEIRRTLADDGAILAHVDWRSSHHVRLLLDEVFGAERFINHIVWSYGLGGSSPRSFARKHDDILYYSKGSHYYFQPPMVPATSQRLAGRLKKSTDVLQIPALNNMALERTGYPTQKPLALLSLLIEACAAPGATVLDPFCGSGTTLVAAVASGREAIGFDVSSAALSTARKRLHAVVPANHLALGRA